MYPNLGYLYQSITGRQAPVFLSVFQMFGFMMALAFLFAAWILSREMKRKEKLGFLKSVEREVIVGAPASVSELVWSGIWGFVIGYKLLAIFFDAKTFSANPQAFLLSSQGNLFTGIGLAIVMVYLRYREKEKKKLPAPEKKKMLMPPHQLVGDITIIAAISGIIGSKLLDSIEHWDDLMSDPFGMLFSVSGLAFYGGLILGSLCVIYYCIKNKLPVVHMADAAAPALILAYGIGRIGCQVAGDGDWGVVNSAYITDSTGQVEPSSPEQFQERLQQFSFYYGGGHEMPQNVPHKNVSAPSWLPLWLFAQAYTHNVNNDGFSVAGCEGNYCAALPIPVFPTPFYETILALLIFALLMLLRARLQIPGMIFSVYLILNGIERYFIEIIRVNQHYNVLGVQLTQAQIIAVFMVLTGISLIVFLRRKKQQQETA